MNAHNCAYELYASKSSIKSTKDTEIEIILKTTRQLKLAYQNRREHYSEFASAIQLNRRLWLAFATDVASAQNGLPEVLRAQLFYLGEFVQNYSRRVLKDDEDATPLIDINLAILRGLGTRTGEP